MAKISDQLIKEFIKAAPQTIAELSALKRRLAKKFSIPLPTNAELIAALRLNHRGAALVNVLKKRAIRTGSGIAPVAVLTSPFPCPGRCAYCPTDKNIPQSYLANEPAVMRAVHCDFQPYQQVSYRLRALEANGHEPTKIELIIIGGTWSALPKNYQYWFITECFRAANDFSRNTQHITHNTSYKKSTLSKLKDLLLKEQKKNETTKYKIIGLTLETRPDYINQEELWRMRELGATRVEMGVQALDDKILKLNRRDSTVADIARATKLLKNFGFKTTYHFMPALPGSTPARDLAMFQAMFSPDKQSPIAPLERNPHNLPKLLAKKLLNNDFNPDQIKFYPTVVTKGSLLYKWWRADQYQPYTDQQLQQLIIDCKKIIPPFVRIIRLIRDIPSESIIAGNKITNLRQIIKNAGAVCRCIRCREIGQEKFTFKDCELFAQKYRSAGADEYFINFANRDQSRLYGFARLRLPELPPHHDPQTASPFQYTAFLRELHVYGELVSVGRAGQKVQHHGLGKRLIKQAETIARLAGCQKLAIISGVGVRGYYKKLGYRLYKTYLIKRL